MLFVPSRHFLMSLCGFGNLKKLYKNMPHAGQFFSKHFIHLMSADKKNLLANKLVFLGVLEFLCDVEIGLLLRHGQAFGDLFSFLWPLWLFAWSTDLSKPAAKKYCWCCEFLSKQVAKCSKCWKTRKQQKNEFTDSGNLERKFNDF